jgi:hypothetical protein
MLITLFAAALALQDVPAPVPADPSAMQPAITLDQLSIEQSAAARCAIAFAAVSRWQKAGDPRGAAHPDMEAGGGREFFVQVMAKIMDEAGLTRQSIIALAADGFESYDKPEGAERLAAMMPACQMMKSAAGL